VYCCGVLQQYHSTPSGSSSTAQLSLPKMSITHTYLQTFLLQIIIMMGMTAAMGMTITPRATVRAMGTTGVTTKDMTEDMIKGIKSTSHTLQHQDRAPSRLPAHQVPTPPAPHQAPARLGLTEARRPCSVSPVQRALMQSGRGTRPAVLRVRLAGRHSERARCRESSVVSMGVGADGSTKSSTPVLLQL
jgi:hypothetical protein